ncbi:unnamed protein product [Rotaria socialis]|nr:unnamed protein product [Rotaria socialis]
MPSIKTAKESQCSWQKVLTVICIIHAIILVVAVIVIPIYISRLIISEITTTTAATTTVYLPNQCSNYTLDTDATRLSTYTIGSSGCDVTTYATPLWVRFTGGGATQLATTTPQTYRCATSATGWLVSALPSTVGSVVTGLVCFNWSSNICYWSSTISVANCNTFYIFLLVSPSQCSLRYCTQ